MRKRETNEKPAGNCGNLRYETELKTGFIPVLQYLNAKYWGSSILSIVTYNQYIPNSLAFI